MADTPGAPFEPVEAAVEPLPLRFFGDQVLRKMTEPITEITGEIVELAERMIRTMDVEAGVGLAAPQVGVSLRMFTHALADQAPQVLINPEIREMAGEWLYQEGCLSIPGLFYDVVRPNTVHVVAYGLDGNEFEIEGDELLGRVIQHELDHLNGVLFVDRLTGQARAEAETELRERVAGTLGSNDPILVGRRVPGLRKNVAGGPKPTVRVELAQDED